MREYTKCAGSPEPDSPIGHSTPAQSPEMVVLSCAESGPKRKKSNRLTRLPLFVSYVWRLKVSTLLGD